MEKIHCPTSFKGQSLVLVLHFHLSPAFVIARDKPLIDAKTL